MSNHKFKALVHLVFWNLNCGVQVSQASATLDNERVVEVAGFTETVYITRETRLDIKA